MPLNEIPILFVPDSGAMFIGIIFGPVVAAFCYVLALTNYLRHRPRPATASVFFACAGGGALLHWSGWSEDWTVTALAAATVIAAGLVSVEVIARRLGRHARTVAFAFGALGASYFFLMCCVACAGC